MRIAIIGCGNMGTALARRLSKDHQLVLHDRDPVWTEGLAKEIYAQACQHIRDVVHEADIVILAVKPEHLQEVADQIAPALESKQILVSLLAGIPLDDLKSFFPSAKLVRMMPNIAAGYGEGVIGLAASEKIDGELKGELGKTFQPLGKIYWLNEEKMNALTSLTGSGPAFVFVMIESMIEAGIAMGFSAADAKQLVMHMIEGSLTVMKETKKHPSELKWQIASPSGTTIEGLIQLEDDGLRRAILNTFLASYHRAEEISFENRFNP